MPNLVKYNYEWFPLEHHKIEMKKKEKKKKKDTSSKGDLLSTIVFFIQNKVNKRVQSSMVDYYLLTKIISICD